MAVDFLSDEQAAGFGRFPDEVSREDLERSCWLDDADLLVARRRRGMHNRLGFAVQLATVRVVGRFLTDPLVVPWPVVESLAGQLGIADASAFKLYAQRGQTGYEHAAEISAVYGYVDLADPVMYEELRLFLSARAWSSSEGPVRLFERAALWLRERKVLLPGVSTLTRLVAEVRAGENDRLYSVLIDAAGPALIQELEALLRVEDGSRLTAWERLRTGPSRVSVPELLRQLDRLTRLQALGAGTIDVETVPAGRMNALARYGLAGKASALQGLSGQRRGATLLCAVRALTSEVADDLCDALDAIVTERVVRKAARESTAARLKSLPRLSKASLQLAQAAKTLVEVLGNTEYSSAGAASVLAEQVSFPELRAAIDVVTELVNPDGSEGDTAAEMMRRFTTVRSFLPALASAKLFGATAGGDPTSAALGALPDVLDGRKTDPSQVDLSVLSPAWQRLIEAAGEIDRRAYTVAVMDAVHKALRRRDIFVVGGRRWGDPRARLLTDPAWQETKNETLTSLQLSEEPAAHLEGVRHSLDARYRAAADQLANNTAVRIDDAGKVHLSPLEAKTIPESLTQLRGLVSAMLPQVDLPDVLLEVHSWTGFLSEFSHVSEASARMDQLAVSVAAILVAEACNVGLTPVVKDGHPALTRGRLAHVDQHYVRADTLRAANSQLVQAQSALGLAQRWGTGLLASVDGMRFVVPVATVNAGANPRYFGHGRGLTWLNYLNDQVAGLGAVVVPGTVRDSLHILDGLLDLDVGQRPEMVATDTASYSDQIFGLFTLLGYRFSPRLAGLPDQRFWRIGTTADYGQLNAVAGRNRINLDLITANWPDMLRLAGSLTAGTVRASEILRVTQGGGAPTLLGKALAEYGRIAKTEHLLDFIDVDEGYRQQIHTQLTLQESRHALARLVFHGRRGQIRQSYREGQEDQLGALGLVLNAVILWNTRYLDAALTELRGRGASVADEDVRRLSPLVSEHINMLGRYTFTADSTGTQLRPFPNVEEDRET
ncbi:Tn3 family transposase [Cryobacterium psychrophilum]|uniref:Tn3 family transposase n=1 Tax=Cryobacterium psychrophilum TaxID=41988 RepID=A0A4Y8KJ89_9MICO|nr:Tn3 family transposase [Cryobacterium psychrophilum]TDW26979.1 TnpA family transposase [Cryobacterium psychrophilum]TFD75292.1 Tn3 family transposase [Cryobacterium psychrophilum]